jgi:hypothetical protein
MALDYSQKRLLNEPLHAKKGSERTRRLQLYAVLTGFLSTLVSLVTLIVRAFK